MDILEILEEEESASQPSAESDIIEGIDDDLLLDEESDTQTIFLQEVTYDDSSVLVSLDRIAVNLFYILLVLLCFLTIYVFRGYRAKLKGDS